MYKQLTKEDRLRIYEGLNRNESLSEIGRAIGKNRSTVVREIKRKQGSKTMLIYRTDEEVCQEEGGMPYARSMRQRMPQKELLEM